MIYNSNASVRRDIERLAEKHKYIRPMQDSQGSFSFMGFCPSPATQLPYPHTHFLPSCSLISKTDMWWTTLELLFIIHRYYCPWNILWLLLVERTIVRAVLCIVVYMHTLVKWHIIDIHSNCCGIIEDNKSVLSYDLAICSNAGRPMCKQ